jgi:hypothetical protein
MSPLTFSDDVKQQLFQKWADRQESFATKDAAKASLPYSIKLPTENIADIHSIYITKDADPSNREIYVYYNGGVSGVHLYISKKPNKPDFQESVNHITADMKAGIAKNDVAPKIINLNGNDAWAIEPGNNIVDGIKYPRPGVLLWWDNGVLYDLYGTPGISGTSLSELIQIAESSQPV